MRFEWDENKRRANLRRHGIDFAAVQKVFDRPTLSIRHERFDYGEVRFQTLGLLGYEIIAITHSETDDVIRIISVRKATKHEEENYFKKAGY